MSIEQIFKSYDIRGKVKTELTPELVKRVGQAFGEYLPVKGVVAIGRDMRPDSKQLSEAFIEGLRDVGRNVWDIGEVTSDMIYFAIGKFELSGGAVITASHNAGDDNGIKLYRDKVTPVGLDSGLSDIRDMVLGDWQPTIKNKGTVTSKNIVDEWVDHCLKFVHTINPYKIAIDTGNGMAGAILPSILPKLPITVEQLYFELDGTFPHHEANPQKIENLQDLIKKVQDNNYDFGIAFDGDGDRAVFVDDRGRPVLGTDLMTIVAKYYLEKHPGSPIVHDVRTSRATIEQIKKWGGIPVRSKAGRVNVGALLRKVGGSFGGETTGHFFYEENYDADSGMIVALTAMQALSNSGKRLSELVDEYRLYAMEPEINFDTTQKENIFQKIRELYVSYDIDELDGITVEAPNFWFNIRGSNTEPVMRLNAEASTPELLKKLTDDLSTLIETVS